MSLNENFSPEPKTTKDWLMVLVKDFDQQRKQLDVLQSKVDRLENDLIKREAKNKIILWIVGIIAAFFGAIAAEIVNKR